MKKATAIFDVEKLLLDSEAHKIRIMEEMAQAFRTVFKIDASTYSIVSKMIGTYNYLANRTGVDESTLSHTFHAEFKQMLGSSDIESLDSSKLANLENNIWDIRDVINWSMNTSNTYDKGKELIKALKDSKKINNLVVFTSGVEGSQRFKVSHLEELLSLEFDETYVFDKKDGDGLYGILHNRGLKDLKNVIYITGGTENEEYLPLKLGLDTIKINELDEINRHKYPSLNNYYYESEKVDKKNLHRFEKIRDFKGVL